MASSIPFTPSNPILRRSSSLPANSASSPDPQIEVLLNLPSARIVSFTTVSPVARPSSSNGSMAAEEEPGTLSCTSRFERTIAVGPLRIYRAPGSVAFLNCSNALRPILPKSQCWEVDASGKFVLQIRRPQYWRIEVPNKSSIEREQVEKLKEVLAKVLLFEKTPCPFLRDFTIELPDAPQTPVKKRPWKPVQRPRLDMTPLVKISDDAGSSVTKPVSGHKSDAEAITPVTLRQLKHVGPEYVLSLSLARPASEISELNQMSSSPVEGRGVISDVRIPPELVPDTSPLINPPGSPSEIVLDEFTFENYHELEDGDSFNEAADDSSITPRSLLQPAFQSTTLELEKETRPQALQNCSRSITAPPVLSLITSPPSKHRIKSSHMGTTIAESDSDFSSSVDSFYSVQSWHSPLAPPSPPASGSSSPTSTYPYPHDNIVLPKRPSHTRDASELTVTPDTSQRWEMSPIPDVDIRLESISPNLRIPTLINDSIEKSVEVKFQTKSASVTRPNVRHRATTSSNSRRRTLSPLPAAVNLFSPPRRRSRRLQTARHLPTAIIQKTCEILLSPPSHLLQLMLNIASKIAAGEWRGVLSGHGEAVHWDFEDEYAGEGWHEDDYGMDLSRTANKHGKQKSNAPGGSWEVD